MVKLTVLYNLPPDMDAAEFVRWRTTTHQEENAGMPGVIKTDFYIAVDEPDGTPPRYRYVTEVWWETMEELKFAFYDPEVQAQLAKDGETFTDRLFLISAECVATDRHS
jgi:uncharacterized protein (TIGR02118 family)